MFNIGDKVVYPMHGAGTIEGIEEKNILGEQQSYYIIKMPGEVKVMVPTAKAEEIGVRDIIDGDVYEVADVVRSLSFKQKEKGLSTGEKKMLLNAKQILVSELTLAENSSKDEIEELVNNTINNSFTEYSKNIANATPDNIVKKFIPFNGTEN